MYMYIYSYIYIYMCMPLLNTCTFSAREGLQLGICDSAGSKTRT